MSLQGFERESDIEERKRKRQEEWEKVRTAEQPLDAPEESLVDLRPLYDRLKEQKDAKELEFEESKKLKNLIRGLDEEEIDYLLEIEKRKINDENRIREEEKAVLNEMSEKQFLARSEDSSSKSNINNGIEKRKISQPKTNSQKALLSNAIKKSVTNNSATGSKRPSETIVENDADEVTSKSSKKFGYAKKNSLIPVAILPGIGDYDSESETSDSSDWSGTDYMNADIDLFGRKKQIRRSCADDDDDD